MVDRGRSTIRIRANTNLLAYFGSFPDSGSNFLRIIIIRTAGPVFMTLTNFQVPLWSVFFSIILLNEPFKISMIIALALILIGLAISQMSEIKKLIKINSL